MGNPRMLTVFTLATAIVIGVVVSLATNNWLFLALAIGIHAITTAFVLGVVFRRIDQGDKPDPVTEAHMEAEDGTGGGTGALTDSGRRKDREVVL